MKEGNVIRASAQTVSTVGELITFASEEVAWTLAVTARNLANAYSNRRSRALKRMIKTKKWPVGCAVVISRTSDYCMLVYKHSTDRRYGGNFKILHFNTG